MYSAKLADSEVELIGERSLVRTGECNSGDLITDALYWYIVEHPEYISVDPEHVVAVVNRGSIRDTISKGEVTMKDLHTVIPFSDNIAVVTLKSSELLELLEAATFAAPEQSGGYPQTAGICFTIDTAKSYDAGEQFPNSTYYAPKSIQRVSIESVNGQAFDPDADYALVTNTFCARGGDTYSLCGMKNWLDTGEDIEQTVQDYLTDVLEGEITMMQYGEPRGDQTIIYADGTAPAAESTGSAGTEGSAAKNGNEAGAETYEVVSGDSLWKIADKVYGDGTAWIRIYEANTAQIAQPDLIWPGQQLKIPA